MNHELIPVKALKQALLIVLLAAVIGLTANFLNPRGVQHTPDRPAATSAADSVFSLSAAEQQLDGPVTINTDQVRKLLLDGEAVLLDARTLQEYRSGHIPGALNLPYEEIFEHENIYNSLPFDKWLVCYCEGPPCDLGELLAWELYNMGFKSVAVYTDGLNEWAKTQEIEYVDTEPDYDN